MILSMLSQAASGSIKLAWRQISAQHDGRHVTKKAAIGMA